MRLTVDAVKNVKFEHSKKGYSAEQVDEFLDSVCADMQEMNRKLEESERSLEKYKEMESTLTCVLVSAQNNAQKIEEEAKARAGAVIQEAEEKAKKMRLSLEAEAFAYREKIKAEQQALAEKANELREFYASYKAAILSELRDFEEKFEAVQPAEKIWEEKPAEIAQAPAAEAQTAPESNAAETAGGDFDMSDILKNLPESDSDLKAMIDELI